MPDVSTILVAVALAVVPSLVYLAILNAIDRYEKEPWTILLACIGAGAIVAPVLSLAILTLAGRPAQLPPAFAPGPSPDALVGIVECLVLGLLLIGLVHSVRDEFDDVLDGVIYGAALGAGFGAAESFLYVLGRTTQVEGGVPIGQLVIAGLNHAFYMAVFGAILGWSQRLPRFQRWVAIVLGLGTATWLNAFHDTFPVILSRVLDQPDAAIGAVARLVAELINWLGILTLAIIVVAAWRREARILRAELADEVTAGVVPQADFDTITSFGGRLGRQWALLRTSGLGPVRRLRRRYATEGELAFHKQRQAHRHRHVPPAERGDALRAEIRSLTDAQPEATA
ncbi:MAG TPA: PrsW family glutamic-type intramembrane protease [Candidatus Limnocylindrales bacterium]|nr:PrsW family glutamic-type intramembrane protease [Candidatus Limnocylindrales bacterium]